MNEILCARLFGALARPHHQHTSDLSTAASAENNININNNKKQSSRININKVTRNSRDKRWRLNYEP